MASTTRRPNMTKSKHPLKQIKESNLVKSCQGSDNLAFGTEQDLIIFTIFALSAGFPLRNINIGKTDNQNHPDLEVRVVLVTCIFNIDFW